jgi:quinol monooxygenase YgiN
MLAVSGWLRFRSEDLLEVRRALVDIGLRSRADAGCLEYWWAEDLDDPGVFRFFECWESREMFAAHRAAPYEQEFMATVLTMVVDAGAHDYEIGERRPATG